MLGRFFARPELVQDDIETILQMVSEHEREDAATGVTRPFWLLFRYQKDLRMRPRISMAFSLRLSQGWP